MAFDPVARLIDPASVRENRAGRLASSQRSRLTDGAYRSRYERVAGSLAALATAAAASAYTANLATASDPERLTVYAFSAAIAILAVIVFRPWADPLGADVRSGVVEHVTGNPIGRASLRSVGRGAWRPSYELTIGGLRFSVPAWLWGAVDEGRTVTAHYLPRSMSLVSIEAADERDLPPILPSQSRRVPIRAGRPMAIASFGAVGLGLLLRASLPPAELVPEIPAGLLFLAIAAAVWLRGGDARSAATG
jgi:hypothetical protein